MNKLLVLDGNPLDIQQLIELPTTLKLHPDVKRKMRKARYAVKNCEETVYGVNTGVGKLCNEKIDDAEQLEYQENILKSHAASVGRTADDEVVKYTMIFKINSLAMGHSGVSYGLLDYMVKMYNNGIIPQLPELGSVGASGDLAPLSHLGMALTENGIVKYRETILPVSILYKELGFTKYTFKTKEALSLINGTQFTCANAFVGLASTMHLVDHAIVSGSLTVSTISGNTRPFEQQLNAVKKHSSQQKTAEIYRTLLSDVTKHSDNVQDPYSLRCQPQVMGACINTLNRAREDIMNEINSCSDNPVVVDGEFYSGGNFHAEYVGFACDSLALAITEIGNITERRISQLMENGSDNIFFGDGSGKDSGLMMLHVTAASLASENKSKCFPHTADTIPTCADQEDHVSMATGAAIRLMSMAHNLAFIISIEYYCNSKAKRHNVKLEKILDRVLDVQYANNTPLGIIVEKIKWNLSNIKDPINKVLSYENRS